MESFTFVEVPAVVDDSIPSLTDPLVAWNEHHENNGNFSRSRSDAGDLSTPDARGIVLTYVENCLSLIIHNDRDNKNPPSAET